MSKSVVVISGYGLNCEEETLHGFEKNGFKGSIVHINDLADDPKMLLQNQIIALPGGFSYGDDTGSGKAFAQRLRLSLWETLLEFISRDTLMIGICNGCQILANLGLVPGFEKHNGERSVAVTYNLTAQYQCRWVDLIANKHCSSPWLSGIERLHIPVAHGEGRFMMDEKVLAKLQTQNQIGLRYAGPDGLAAQGRFPHNPNGSMDDIAAITDQSGRILAIMPHPERGMFSWQRDDYDRLKDEADRKGEALPAHTDGMALFANAAAYFD